MLLKKYWQPAGVVQGGSQAYLAVVKIIARQTRVVIWLNQNCSLSIFRDL